MQKLQIIAGKIKQKKLFAPFFYLLGQYFEYLNFFGLMCERKNMFFGFHPNFSLLFCRYLAVMKEFSGTASVRLAELEDLFVDMKARVSSPIQKAHTFEVLAFLSVAGPILHGTLEILLRLMLLVHQSIVQKRAKNGPKWSKMGLNGPKWS